jgi:hypothetical protein
MIRSPGRPKRLDTRLRYVCNPRTKRVDQTSQISPLDSKDQGRPGEVVIRVVAAVYSSETAANEGASELTRRYGLGATQLRVAPFGALGPDEDDPVTVPSEATIVLAGRLDEGIVGAAKEFITARGGVIVSDVDERMTGSRGSPSDSESPLVGG